MLAKCDEYRNQSDIQEDNVFQMRFLVCVLCKVRKLVRDAKTGIHRCDGDRQELRIACNINNEHNRSLCGR